MTRPRRLRLAATAALTGLTVVAMLLVLTTPLAAAAPGIPLPPPPPSATTTTTTPTTTSGAQSQGAATQAAARTPTAGAPASAKSAATTTTTTTNPTTTSQPAGSAGGSTTGSATGAASDDARSVPLPQGISPYPLVAYHAFYSDQTGLKTTSDFLFKDVTAPFKQHKSVSMSALISGYVAEGAFSVAKWLVGIAVWLITWAFSFKFAGWLAQPAARMADTVRTDLINPMGLVTLALLLAGFFLVGQYLRGRSGRGYAEVLISLVILAVTASIVPLRLFNTAMNFDARLSGTILVVMTGGNPASTTAPGTGQDLGGAGYSHGTYLPYVHTYARELVTAYVAQPADLLTWGAIPTGHCAVLRDRILAHSPHYSATDQEARDTMRSDPACAKLADASDASDWDRVWAAVLVMLVALLILVVIGMVVVPIAAAQIILALLLVAFPFAAVAALVPGWGRQALHRWVVAELTAHAAIVVCSVLLSALVWLGATMTANLATATDSVPGRMLPLLIGPLAVLLFRKRLFRMTHTGLAHLGGRLEAARLGGSRGPAWLGSPGVGAGALGMSTVALWRTGHGQYKTAAARAHGMRTLIAGDAKSGRPGLLLAAPPKPSRAITGRGPAAAPAGSSAPTTFGKLIGAGTAAGAAATGDGDTGEQAPPREIVTRTTTTKQTRRGAITATTTKPGGRGQQPVKQVTKRGHDTTTVRTVTETRKPAPEPRATQAANAGAGDPAAARRQRAAARLAGGRVGRAAIGTARAATKAGHIAFTIANPANSAREVGRMVAAAQHRRRQAVNGWQAARPAREATARHVLHARVDPAGYASHVAQGAKTRVTDAYRQGHAQRTEQANRGRGGDRNGKNGKTGSRKRA